MKNANGNKFKKPNVNTPNDWPRAGKEVGEGDWVIFSFYILRWKLYKRPANFKIYGFSHARHVYTRIWWGKKVLHFRFKIRRIQRPSK